MVVTIGDILRNVVDDPIEFLEGIGYDIKVTRETGEDGNEYISKRVASHINPDGIREEVYEEFFKQGTDRPYQTRYFPEERNARHLRATSVLPLLH